MTSTDHSPRFNGTVEDVVHFKSRSSSVIGRLSSHHHRLCRHIFAVWKGSSIGHDMVNDVVLNILLGRSFFHEKGLYFPNSKLIEIFVVPSKTDPRPPSTAEFHELFQGEQTVNRR